MTAAILQLHPPLQAELPLKPEREGTPAVINHQPRSLAMATIDRQRTAMETALGYLEAIADENVKALGIADASRLVAARAHLRTALRWRGK